MACLSEEPGGELNKGISGLCLKKELRNAILELESQKHALEKCLNKWKALEESFISMESQLSSREDTLAKKEKEFDEKMKSNFKAKEELLDVKPNDALKDNDVSCAPANGKKQKGIASEKSIEPQSKLLKEAQVTFSQAEHNTSKSPEHSELIAQKTVKIEKQDAESSLIHAPASAPAPAPTLTPTAVGPISLAEPSSKESKKSKIRSDLNEACRATDFEELIKLLIHRRKDFSIIITELPLALKSAPDPITLVLNSLDGYPSGNNSENSGTEKIEKENFNALQRALVILLESTAAILPDLPAISESMRSQAKSISDNWLKYFNSKQNMSALDSQIFLQLVSMFDIAKDYSSDELFKFVYSIARRKQSPALCKSLGLTEKIPDFVDKLVKDGKHIEAVSFAYAFKIMNRIEPVKLLQDHLDQLTKNSNSAQKNSNNSSSGQIDNCGQELGALKLVVNCIKEFELESVFPSQPLIKKIEQLEKDKADRKRSSAVVKPQTKRLRGNSGSGNVASGNSGLGNNSPGPSNTLTNTNNSNPNLNSSSPKTSLPNNNKGYSNKRANYKTSHNSSPNHSHAQINSQYTPQAMPPASFSTSPHGTYNPSYGVSLVYVPGSPSSYVPGSPSNYVPSSPSNYVPGSTSNYVPGSTSNYVSGNPSNYSVGSQGDYAPLGVGGNYSYSAGNLATVSGTGTYVIPVDSIPFQSQVPLSYNNQIMPYHFNGSLPAAHVSDASPLSESVYLY